MVAATESAGRGLSGPTILVVDDQEAVRRVVRLSLRTEQVEVVEAGTSAEALRLASELSDLALIIADYELPGRHGRDLVDEIRAQHPDLPALFISGSLEVGPTEARTDFLPKPFTPAQLTERVRGLLPADKRSD